MTEFILEIILRAGYLGIFVLMALENVFPPMPSEIVMGAGGVLVARGEMGFVPLLVSGTLGTLAGNLPWYWLGHRWSEAQLRRFIERHGRWLTFDWQHFNELREKFLRHGEAIVFVMRFSPFFRTMISLPAGLAGMGLVRFCLFTLAGSLIWNAALILGGQAISGLIETYQEIASMIVGATIVLALGWYVWRVIKWKPASERS